MDFSNVELQLLFFSVDHYKNSIENFIDECLDAGIYINLDNFYTEISKLCKLQNKLNVFKEELE